MKVSNEFNAPLPFVRTAEKSSWPPNPDRLYVTQLFAPPMQRRLTIDHFDEIEVDVTDLYYRILGTSVHSVIEEAAKGLVGVSSEIRVAMPKEWFGIEITGRIDWINFITGILADIKTASVNSYGRGIKDDWVYQGNIYRYMLRRCHDYLAKELRIYPMYRDWSAMQATGSHYPASAFGNIELPVWSLKETHAFIEKCVADHLAPEVRGCTDEERWKTPDCFAVKKKGQDKAVAATAVQDGTRGPILTRKLAQEILEGKPKHEDMFIEERPGGFRRCENYCDVCDICKKYNPELWGGKKKKVKSKATTTKKKTKASE